MKHAFRVVAGIFGGALLLGVISPAAAQTVTVNFKARVDKDTLFGTLAGDQICGRLFYDASAPDGDPHSGSGWYDTGALSVKLHGTTYDQQAVGAAPTVRVRYMPDDPHPTNGAKFKAVDQLHFGPYGDLEARLVLSTLRNDVVTSDKLPKFLPGLSCFEDVRTFMIVDGADTKLSATLTSCDTANCPEPMSLALMLPGLAALGVLRRRRAPEQGDLSSAG